MINTGNQPIILSSDPGLPNAVQQSIAHVTDYIAGRFGVKLRRGTKAYVAFYHYFNPEELAHHTLDRNFIYTLYAVAAEPSENSKATTTQLRSLLAYSSNTNPPSAKSASGIKACCKLALFSLWCDRVILLPTTLTNFKTTAFGDFIEQRETEVARFFRQYRTGAGHRPKHSEPLPKSGEWSLGRHSPRLIWATDWHSFEDVKPEEMVELRDARLPSPSDGSKPHISASPFPFSLMLTELYLCHKDKVSFDHRHLEAFAFYTGSPSIRKEWTFLEIMAKGLETVTEIRQTQREQPRTESRQIHSRPPNQASGKPTGANGRSQELSTVLREFAGEHREQAIEDYYCSISHLMARAPDWLEHQSPYPGRETAIDLPRISAVWRRLYHSWLKWRRDVKGYETDTGPKSSLNFFFDYLFLYLPWWFELNPESGARYPVNPKDFTRVLFVSRHSETYDALLAPKTFLELLERRVPRKNGRYVIVNHVIQFFDYIANACADDEHIWGEATNPFRKLLDVPKVTARQKSAKTPFPSATYPYRVNYIYAVEAFGIFVQERSISELRFQRKRDYLVDTFDTEDCGFVPIVFYARRAHPVFYISNMYGFDTREIALDRFISPENGTSGSNSIPFSSLHRYRSVKGKPNIISLKVPNLSTVRMFAGAIELGLRFQSIQWLDLTKWDRLNVNTESTAYYFMLHVNTDKVNDGFDVPLVHRVRAAFLREQKDQLARADREPEAVPYEGREHSRFEYIVPLFRGKKENPVSDKKYRADWSPFLRGFEAFFNNIHSEKPIHLFARPQATQKSRLAAPIVTPHACRNTLIGEKRQYLDIEEVRLMVGHGADVVTAYYHIPDMERLIQKLEQSDSTLFGDDLDQRYADIESLTRESASYIHADDPNSALRRTFNRDRGEAITKQGFTSFTFGHNEWGDGEDGVSVLRSTPSSMIAFLPTHICPVGQICPEEIRPIIEEPKRCGLCPLCVTGVDHVQAISAKRMALLVQIQDKRKLAEKWETEDRSAEEVDRLWAGAALDAKEEGAWRLREERMLFAIRDGQQSMTKDFHVDDPEFVRLHLLTVTKECGEREWMLRALARSYQYPTLQNPEIRAIAEKERLKLLASAGAIDELMQKIEVGDEDEMLAGQLRIILEAKGLTFKGLVSALSGNADRQLLADRNPTLIQYNDGGAQTWE